MTVCFMRSAACLAMLLLLALPAAAAGRGLPAGFVYLREVAPSIAQEIRYATADNFTGRPLPGYRAGECVLRRDVALALARVAADLARRELGLKVYDCYRPRRAVRAFWRWSQRGDGLGSKRFYPHVRKAELFARGYIASHSRHSAGTAVDLTLIKLPTPSPAARSRDSGNPGRSTQTSQAGSGSPLARGRAQEKSAPLATPFDPRKRYGPCTAAAAERAPDNSLDMGTGFDCLDVKSYTRSRAVTAEQHRRRMALRAAMSARGLRNYFREWWHYEYGRPLGLYDFPIVPRLHGAARR